MWLHFLSAVVTVSAILQCTLAAPEKDMVTNLPGLSKQPPFKQYSGYLKGDHIGDKYLHYWFVESSSNAPTDPVVLWLNGGPGCSSDLGFLTEHGPFQIQPDGKTLNYNPFSWNQVANMIYLESPVGVGYSFSHSKDYATNDSAVAIENAVAISDFFEKFPEYKENDFYITGESYGGIYVPTLASQILDIPSIKLKGFAVGNGLSSREDNTNSILYFAYYHGLIGDKDWDYLLDNCCPQGKAGKCNFVKAATEKSECKDKITIISILVWSSGLDVYNLYHECDGGVNTGFSTIYNKEEGKFVSTYFGWPFSFLEVAKLARAELGLIPKGLSKLAIPCTNMSSSIKYMNSPAVRKALHINPDLGEWEPCSMTVSIGYKSIYDTVYPFYEKALSKNLRLLVYNGDVDMACNFLGDEWFVSSLPLKDPQDRKMWYYYAADGTKQVAGFVKTFDQLNFVTVKGSGHMVPTDKPRPALEMFINFIQNKPFNV